MKSKNILLASVVGAVVVGGALTGVTVASFSGSAPLTAGQVEAGSLSLEASPVGAVEQLAPGEHGQAVVTLTERAEGKNLETRRVVDDVAVHGLPAGAVKVELRERRPNDRSACESNGFVDWAEASRIPGQGRQLQLGSTGRPRPTTEVCVRVTLLDGAEELLEAGIGSGSVQVTFASQQVQGDRVTGWESSAAPVEIPVTTGVPPAATVASCAIARGDAEELWARYLDLTWTAVPGADEYRIYRRTPSGDQLLRDGLTAPGSRLYLKRDLDGETRGRYVVRAVADGLEGPPSEPVRTWGFGLIWECAR